MKPRLGNNPLCPLLFLMIPEPDFHDFCMLTHLSSQQKALGWGRARFNSDFLRSSMKQKTEESTGQSSPEFRPGVGRAFDKWGHGWLFKCDRRGWSSSGGVECFGEPPLQNNQSCNQISVSDISQCLCLQWKDFDNNEEMNETQPLNDLLTN